VTVLWGEEYEESCRAIGPHLEADLAAVAAILTLNAYAGKPVIEGSDLYELEYEDVMGLLHVFVAYTIERECEFVVLWGVREARRSE
jgi:hypothetical protein